MTNDANSVAVAVWLGRFEQALAAADAKALEDLFIPGADWRDVVAFTWDMQSTLGAAQLAGRLVKTAATIKPHSFAIAPDRTPPQATVRAGDRVIEGFFSFETSTGHGLGVVRLDLEEGEGKKARTLLTTLQEISGHEEQLGARRPHGPAYSRDFGGKNWLDLRDEELLYTDRSPQVLIVGAGQAGLTVAARLRAIGVDALIVDKHPRVGDVWRKRYHSLVLHNEVWVAHMPYLPFPETWPVYVPKDKMGNWFESYAEIMELNVWTGTEFLSGNYDDPSGRWTVKLRRADGTERELSPQHIIMANGGVSGVPNLPKLPGLDDFKGQVMHSSRYTSGSEFANRKALVIGTGTSGHDVAQDLHGLGSEATIVQRNSTTVVNLEPSAIMVYEIYSKGLPTEDCDLISAANTLPTFVKSNRVMAQKMLEADKELLDRLHAVGFRTDIGEDGTGFHLKYNRRGGGYYLNVGASDLIADKEIGLLQADQIERFVSEGIELKDGSRKALDLVVLATGYRNQQHEVRILFGDAVAERIGPVWGFDDGGEMRNVWRPTAQKGLWFHAGSLAACRANSKYLAVQLKAALEGIHPQYKQ
ncbi:MAG: NAD(P)/FAD-dependent oxidoreductase [Pseudomonadota bacterium]